MQVRYLLNMVQESMIGEYQHQKLIQQLELGWDQVSVFMAILL